MSETLTPAHSPLRLPPLVRRSSLLVWLMALGMRLYLGKVMTPLTVVYARMPRLALPQLFMLRLAERGLHLSPSSCTWCSCACPCAITARSARTCTARWHCARARIAQS